MSEPYYTDGPEGYCPICEGMLEEHQVGLPLQALHRRHSTTVADVEDNGSGPLQPRHNSESERPELHVTCRGCGADANPEHPIPDHCGKCPPWVCEDCGQPCSMADPCGCWIQLEGMALPELKALFALGGLSLEPPS